MENKINLRKLFTTHYEYLPEFIDSNNCIYKITNLVNNNFANQLAQGRVVFI